MSRDRLDRTDFSLYNNDWYKPGSFLRRILWFFANVMFVRCGWNPSSRIRSFVLKLFGARIGKNVILRPGLNIKYPWLLSVGDHSWLGEDVWIDNLAQVSIGSNCCISQGAMLLCGNHNFRTENFELIVKPIVVRNGAWIGARSTVCPGVTLNEESILAVGSIATADLKENTIYQGNPAQAKRKRWN